MSKSFFDTVFLILFFSLVGPSSVIKKVNEGGVLFDLSLLLLKIFILFKERRTMRQKNLIIKFNMMMMIKEREGNKEMVMRDGVSPFFLF